MAETARFLDLVSYSEADFSDFVARVMRPQGIFAESALGTLAVIAPGGMNVRVVPGEALIQGFQYVNNANKDLAIGANSSGSLRVDTVVLRLDRTANLLTAVIKVGTPGAGAPSLTQVAGGTWEFPLFDVQVANGAASIVIGNITPDRRVYSRWSLGALDTTIAEDDDVDAVADDLADEIVDRLADVDAGEAARIAADNALSARITSLEGTRANGFTLRAWGNIGSAGTINAGANVNSVSKGGTGIYNVTLITPLVATPYILLGGPRPEGSLQWQWVQTSTSAFQFQIFNNAGTPTDWSFDFAVVGF